MEISILLAEQILAMFLTMAVGFGVVRAGLFKTEDSRIISNMVVYICNPCVVVHSFQIELTDDKIKGLMIAIGLSVVVHMVLIIGSEILSFIFHFNSIEKASIIYTNEMLMEINETVNQAYNMISMESDRVLDSLRKKSEIIENNKKELMEGLMDMKKQERYADILEISQLLANELYYEKNKAKDEEHKDKNGEPEMVQWEFDFEDKKEPEPIRVKASREPVKSVQRETDDADSSIHVIKDSDHDDKMRRFGDRTPVRLEESITDASAKGSDSDKNGRPDFRIGGRISDAYDDVDDGVV